MRAGRDRVSMMFMIAAYVLLLVGVAASVCAGWWLSLSQKQLDAHTWRRWLLLLGLIANTASLFLFLVLTGSMLVSKGTVNGAELVRTYRMFFPLEVSVAGAALGAFGRRAPRILVMLNGLALAFLWLNLAASSL